MIQAFYYVAASSWLASMAMGTVLGYSAPALASMASNDSSIHLTPTQETWFGSVLAVGALGGSLVTGFLIEFLGRVRTIQFSSMGFIAGSLCIAMCNTSLISLFFGRVLAGFCCGVVSLAVPVFVSEISPPDVRGLLGSCIQLSITLGILLVFVSGKWMDWLTLSLLCAVLPTLMAIAMAFAVESPRWLLANGQRAKAIDALRILYGGSESEVQAQCISIEASLQTAAGGNGESVIRDLFRRSFSVPLVYTLLLMFFQQFCGINVVTFYSVAIFESSGAGIPAADCTILLGVVQVASSFAASLLIDRAGRRLLLFLSSTVITLSLVVLGVFYYYKDGDDAFRQRYRYIPLASLTSYMAAFCLGVGPVPWVVMGEILSPRARGLSTGLSTAFSFLCEFLITKEFQDLVSLFNFSGMFWLFAAMTVVHILFVYACIPETKGKSLEDISHIFESLPVFSTSTATFDRSETELFSRKRRPSGIPQPLEGDQ
ncbi:facilitated trehalose transporter Tret1-2 homolog [Ornithodoros turicata]|uniref:facilitated trehalose transporter Tret1-2 homolog n=1 Tax=Ornithodoros turicata TaxID=34597 RepID=UPI0031389DC7